MSSSIRFFRKYFCAVLCVIGFASHGALVWNGPNITYTQPAFDPTQPANQDRLTPNVWLTRAVSQGLFNATSETLAGLISPSDTEWAYGTADQYTSLQFTNWLGLLNGASPTNFVGKQLVAHFISEDIYISLKFTFWGSKGTGGFTYIRSTPPVRTTLWNPTLLTSNFQFTFNYSTTASSNYVIEASSDLSNWLPLSTNVAPSTVSHIQDSSSDSMRFYRAKQTAP